MKRIDLLFFVMLALCTLSCSSDDKEEDAPPLKKEISIREKYPIAYQYSHAVNLGAQIPDSYPDYFIVNNIDDLKKLPEGTFTDFAIKRWSDIMLRHNSLVIVRSVKAVDDPMVFNFWEDFYLYETGDDEYELNIVYTNFKTLEQLPDPELWILNYYGLVVNRISENSAITIKEKFRTE